MGGIFGNFLMLGGHLLGNALRKEQSKEMYTDFGIRNVGRFMRLVKI